MERATRDPTEVVYLYRQSRIDDQASYYEERARTYERARRHAVTAAASFLGLAALFGALGTADPARRAAWAFVAATLAAVAAAITTYEAAFGFERISRQYKDTLGALRIAESRLPSRSTDMSTEFSDEDLQRFVSRMEAILRSEVDTWSTLAAEHEDEEHG
jgi:hypothetical protein